MDSSITRRGKPCWYLAPNPMESKEKVGLISVNDSLILEGLIYRLLRRYFRQESYYVRLLELFLETTYDTELGQLLDLTSQPKTYVDLDRLNLQNYSKIVIYKTAFYSFYLPIALALVMDGYTDEAAFKEALDILLPMGEFFQVQDDYLDCYGDPKVIGKVGRDIEEKKCGWLVCQALLRATPDQKQLIETQYGREDPVCVRNIKALYKQLDLEAVYKRYEEESFQQLKGRIDKASYVPKAVYIGLLQKIYKRSL